MALNNPYPYGKNVPTIGIVPGATTVPVIIINRYMAYDFVAPATGAATLYESIAKQNISKVSYVYNPNPGAAYPWDTLTHLVIHMHDGEHVTFELQAVADQATWNNGTEADCQAAVAAINASLP